MDSMQRPGNRSSGYDALQALARLADEAPPGVGPNTPPSPDLGGAPPVSEYVGAQQGTTRRQLRGAIEQAAANPVAPPPKVVTPYPDPLQYDMTNPWDVDRYNKDYVEVAIARGDLTLPTAGAVAGQGVTPDAVDQPQQAGMGAEVPQVSGGTAYGNPQPRGPQASVAGPVSGVSGGGRRFAGGGHPAVGGAVHQGGNTPQPAAVARAPVARPGIANTAATSMSQGAAGQGDFSDTPSPAPVDPRREAALKAARSGAPTGYERNPAVHPPSPATLERRSMAQATRDRIKAGELQPGEVSTFGAEGNDLLNKQADQFTAKYKAPLEVYNAGQNIAAGLAAGRTNNPMAPAMPPSRGGGARTSQSQGWEPELQAYKNAKAAWDNTQGGGSNASTQQQRDAAYQKFGEAWARLPKNIQKELGSNGGSPPSNGRPKVGPFKFGNGQEGVDVMPPNTKGAKAAQDAINNRQRPASAPRKPATPAPAPKSAAGSLPGKSKTTITREDEAAAAKRSARDTMDGLTNETRRNGGVKPPETIDWRARNRQHTQNEPERTSRIPAAGQTSSRVNNPAKRTAASQTSGTTVRPAPGQTGSKALKPASTRRSQQAGQGNLTPQQRAKNANVAANSPAPGNTKGMSPAAKQERKDVQFNKRRSGGLKPDSAPNNPTRVSSGAGGRAMPGKTTASGKALPAPKPKFPVRGNTQQTQKLMKQAQEKQKAKRK